MIRPERPIWRRGHADDLGGISPAWQLQPQAQFTGISFPAFAHRHTAARCAPIRAKGGATHAEADRLDPVLRSDLAEA